MDTYKIQYASDLHLETQSVPFDLLLEPCAEDLALCGDIGDPFSPIYFDFLRWVSKRWKRIFLLAGNHEYYSAEGNNALMNDVEKQIHKVVSSVGNNVIFLQKDIFRIETHKILIVGATLWTVPEIRQWGNLNGGFIGDPGYRGDYTQIHITDEYTGKGRSIHPSDIINLCNDHTAFLSRMLNPTWGGYEDGWRVIVLTHHMPTFLLNDTHYKDHSLRSCYAVPLDKLMKEPVVLWLCGHSHKAQQVRFDTGTLTAVNPFGYKSEYGKTGFNNRACIYVYRENIAIPRLGNNLK